MTGQFPIQSVAPTFLRVNDGPLIRCEHVTFEPAKTPEGLDAYNMIRRGKHWVFPPDRFVEYEPKDEVWARVLGFGHEVDYEKEETMVKMTYEKHQWEKLLTRRSP